MGFVELTDVAYALPGGRTLFEGVSFRVAEVEHVALIGVNGIVEVLRKRGMTMTEAMVALRSYGLDRVDPNPFPVLSGGQQARFQLLLMEVDPPTMLLLDEPTDNLDVASADALEEAVRRYEGTVVAVTHDRWFMRSMDRFLFFEADGSVRELLESPYEDAAAVG